MNQPSLDKQLDKRLDIAIKNIRSGKIEEFELIVKHYQKLLLKYVRYLSNNKCDVEDTVQEIFIRIYENLSKYQLGTSLNNWIYKIAYNHTMNVLKKNNRNKVFLLGQLPDIPDTNENDTDISNRTKHALSKLSLEERNLLYLRIYEELSYKKLSEILSSNEMLLRKKYERTRKKFIKAYEKEGNSNEAGQTEINHIGLYK